MRVTIAAVVVIVVILLGAAGILFPAIQAAREAARRMQCGNNVKQLCLGLQNYHDTYERYPYGAQNRLSGSNNEVSWGNSWLFSTMIFNEGGIRWYDKAVAATEAASENDYVSRSVRSHVAGKKINVLLCPSSPLPTMQTLDGYSLTVPSYAGIMGATDERGEPTLKDRSRLVPGPYGGWACGNGMLLVNETLPYAACSDGWANTIVLGEVSDWYYTDAGSKRNPALSIGDAGDGFQNAAGWLAGTNLESRPRNETDGPESLLDPWYIRAGGPAIPPHRVCNLITIHHRVGISNRHGSNDSDPDWGTQGIGRCGLNNPLVSAHPSGAMVGYLDGHVQLLAKETSIVILKRLAGRDESAHWPDDESF